MQSEMTWHRPRGSLVCLVLALCAASTEATEPEPPTHEPAACLTPGVILRDCSDLPSHLPSGVYMLRPALNDQNVPAYCDMDNDGGGWTVVIRRDDIEPRVDFHRDWESYKWGVGELKGEFYWGNEYLWMLTSHLDRRYQLRFQLEDWSGNTRHEHYQNFEVESESANYRMRVSGYSGDAGEAFSHENGSPFSTYDRDNDAYRGHCANMYVAAWWFKACTSCHLTGKYYAGGYSGNDAHGIIWRTWKSTDPYSLKSAVMKIKPLT